MMENTLHHLQKQMIKRLFDIKLSFWGIILLSPLLLVISLAIFLTSRGGVLYRQKRIGKDGKEFNVLKFRTMFKGSDSKGSLTIGVRDSRITGIGYYLRKYKLDE